MYYVIAFLIFLGINISNLCTVLGFNPCNENNVLVTDLDCDKNEFYVPNGNEMFTCFPRCYRKYDITTVPCSSSVPCPQGYFCPEKVGEAFCKIDNESCFKYYTEDDDNNQWHKALWKPECLSNGFWAPKQCKGEQANGRCFCYDARGNKIFGESIVKDSKDMTCACSRKRSEYSKSVTDDTPTLHCDSKGNYEPLQCDKGHCLCVEPKTGKPTSKIVTEEMMTHLPCYDKEKIGEQYLRQCDSELFAQRELLKELKIHGTDGANVSPILCDGDGTYGSYKIDKGQIFCTWKDNLPIGSHSSAIDDLPLVNCNCARDIKIYELRGQKQTLECAGNGNYRPEQQINNKWFCVDQDGFRKSEFFEAKPNNCTSYFQ